MWGEGSEFIMFRFSVVVKVLLVWAHCCAIGFSESDERPAFADYCQRLEQEIQGRKHGFMAGNVTYYVGGFHASWNVVEDETIGLTHPFHHDLRSRGVGILESKIVGPEHTGTGNDFRGWEFYKDTRVLYGSVVVDDKTYKNPKPLSMVWRPDKLICKYRVAGVEIREEKFIAANDTVASVVTASEPVVLKFAGNSFYHRNSVTSSAAIEFSAEHNAVVITEGGTVRCVPDPGGIERTGPCVYQGMTTVLGASRDISQTVTFRKDKRGVQQYSFTVPCDRDGVVVSWAMNDHRATALAATHDVIRNYKSTLAAKTAEVNRQLNDEIPWFRCSDKRFVDIYYYLWSLYLMYYIDVGEGWEQENHTQTAVNNFLGMHRYDATFQIKVGAWTTNKPKYAYGNVLTWKHLTQDNRFRELPDGLRMISDNKGKSWHSGAYGAEASEHVLGAWQIYEHTSDVEFVKECYSQHFEKLFRKRLSVFAMNQFEVAETLEKMARLTEDEAGVAHWRKLVRREPKHIRQMFDDRWQMNGVRNYFAAPDNGMIMTNGFWAMRSRHFPRKYVRPMVDAWALDADKGLYGKFFPLAMSKQSMAVFKTPVDHSFGYTPDTAYFTLDGLFQQCVPEAAKLTLNHLENYNYHDQWQIPVAPEAYRRDLKLFGDQYSNFNAGKILLYLEGLAGLDYSVPQKRLSIRPTLPKSWEWMEIRLPVAGQWTRIRYSTDGVQVSGSPFSVVDETTGAKIPNLPSALESK